MAGYFAQTIIIGNVGRDPEIKNLANGSTVCNFTVAVSRNWTDKQSNERREETTWFRVECWSNLAEIANQYIRKGKQVMVVGQVKARAYLDNSQQPQASLELRADNFQLLGRKEEGDGSSNDSGGREYNNAPRGGSENFEDIPF